MKSHTTVDSDKHSGASPLPSKSELAKRIGSFNRTHIQAFDSNEYTTNSLFMQLESIAPLAVGVLDGEEIIGFWIGSHKDYERVIAHPETVQPSSRARRQPEVGNDSRGLRRTTARFRMEIGSFSISELRNKATSNLQSPMRLAQPARRGQ